jgi:murein DD-endopeptidase MepM/ murein hydrolase activator NlpD
MWQLPFPDSKLADPFGAWPPARKKMGLGPHRGVDWNGMKKGAPLKAVNDGVISANYWSDILGWVVELKVKGTWKGKPKAVHFMYCHLDKQSPLKVGTKVKSGESVGAAGTSGSASSGIHLHFTLSLTSKGGAIGKVYDPVAYIKRRIKEEEKENAQIA